MQLLGQLRVAKPVLRPATLTSLNLYNVQAIINKQDNMVMEALAAVSLAGNVVQFVEFSCKLFEQATTIYHTGTARGAQDIETLTQQLQALCADLAHGNNSVQQPRPTRLPDQGSLQKLAKDCETVANELLFELHELRAKDPNSKWSSFRAALAVSWKEKRVDAMQKRLDSYRSQLVVHLQVLQSDKQSGMFRLLEDLRRQNQRLGAELADQITDAKETFQLAITTLKDDLIERSSSGTPVPKSTQFSLDEEVSACTTTLLQIAAFCTNTDASLHVLDSLRLEQIDYRQAQIRDAHPQTCTWMFSDQFSRWIESPEPVFWISGKPGSGKSTLMKFLADNPQTLERLRQSSEQQIQVVASYYFWVNGTDMQRSQEGLLRALLFDLLRQCPAYIPKIIPEPWNVQQRTEASSTRLSYSWKRSELLRAFQRLTKLDTRATRFCVFIDGLDEYHGDHDELIEVIQDLGRSNIKLCVASRPWNVFEDAFGKSLEFKIYLQDFNKADIHLYVKETLTGRTDWQILEEKDHQAALEIVEEIVNKSKGVFLWVFLVVRSMIEGVRNRDRLSQLQMRLKAFPSDLEEYFRHIFESLDPTYRTQTAKAFQVALIAHRSLPPIIYWFLDEEEDSPRHDISAPVKEIPLDELDKRQNEMRIRLNGRCKGLLECSNITWGEEDVVDFLHRTVKDFLMTPEMQRTFASLLNEDFDPYSSICTASLVLLKSTPTILLRPVLVLLLFEVFFNSALHYERSNRMLPMEYFYELDRTVSTLATNSETTKSVLWYRGTRQHSLLSSAVRYNLRLFVEARLRSCKDISASTIISLVKASSHLSAGDRLEMLQAILAFSPQRILTDDIQDCLAQVMAKGDDAYQLLRNLSELATFEIIGEGRFEGRFTSQRLDKKLEQLSSHQRDEIRGLIARKPMREAERAPSQLAALTPSPVYLNDTKGKLRVRQKLRFFALRRKRDVVRSESKTERRSRVWCW
ncbi:hypothetical protein K491DRAFT_710188 [Lophiostoma macrostomum CBS 122681]|uniref:Uncharacterized protein n=1 Tax=Lophiostoma macrostomum CBS 122681 TaxID=1314788 RepID=A0A6A6TUE6_9PLEO|nr:hypothetical protein K491DRAFT_710188 [Lophiostoma macrostomum CBS 122681]